MPAIQLFSERQCTKRIDSRIALSILMKKFPVIQFGCRTHFALLARLLGGKLRNFFCVFVSLNLSLLYSLFRVVMFMGLLSLVGRSVGSYRFCGRLRVYGTVSWLAWLMDRNLQLLLHFKFDLRNCAHKQWDGGNPIHTSYQIEMFNGSTRRVGKQIVNYCQFLTTFRMAMLD